MKVLQIDYENGSMVLFIERFFPCKLQDARKIFPLINRCCPDEDKEMLKAELLGMEQACKDKESQRCRRIRRNISMIS